MKSTLLKCIGGLSPFFRPFSFDDKKILKPGFERGIVFQNYSLYPWLTVWENVIGLRLQAQKNYILKEVILAMNLQSTT